jgi:hypothetical protein
MDTTLYAFIVALVAIIYSLMVRKIQYKYGKQKEMEALNIESKKLNEEYKKASARNDKKAMEEIMKKQMELLNKMWAGVFNQFKIMITIMIIFLAFTWATTFFDPTTNDDVLVELNDNGTSCDEKSGDGVYTGCYKLSYNKDGVWMVDVKVYKDDNVIGENSTIFLVGKENPDSLENAYVKRASGSAPPGVFTDKKIYAAGDEIKIMAILKEGNAAKAILNSGTWFYVDLPFTIPLLNIKRINEPYWWFIFVALTSSFLISVLVSKIEPLKKLLS